MHRLHRHLRGLVVALAAIALSAGVVLAGRPVGIPPAPAADGLQRATEAASKTVPVTVDPPAAQPDQPNGADEDADQGAEDQGAEDQEGGDAAKGSETTDGTNQAAERPQNHGWFVSQAAQADTPAEFANHGAYVSSIAKSDVGKPAAATKHASGASTSAAAKAAASSKHHGRGH